VKLPSGLLRLPAPPSFFRTEYFDEIGDQLRTGELAEFAPSVADAPLYHGPGQNESVNSCRVTGSTNAL